MSTVNEPGPGEFQRTMRWRCRIEADLHAINVWPVFARTRTYLARVELLHYPGDAAQTPDRRWTLLRHDVRRSAELDDCSARAGCVFDLVVTYSGDSPILTDIRWELNPGVIVPRHSEARAHERFHQVGTSSAHAPAEDPPGDPVLRGLVSNAEAARSVPAKVSSAASTTTLSGEATIRARREGLEFAARAQRYFLELEEATSPSTTDGKRRELIHRLRGRLDVRIAARAFHGASGRVPDFARLSDRDGVLAAALRGTSSLMVTLTRRHLDYGDRDLFGWAFELFVTDRIAAVHPDPAAEDALTAHGAANGTEFFKFTELALLCIQESVDAAFWEARLLDLVRSTELFMIHTGHPLEGECTAHCPGTMTYTEGRFTPREIIRELRQRYQVEAEGVGQHEFVEWLSSHFSKLVTHAFKNVGTVAIGGVAHQAPWEPGLTGAEPMQMA